MAAPINDLINGTTTVRDIALAISMRQIDGYDVIDKFGENPDIDTGTVPEDIWDVGGEYTYDTWGTAPIQSIISDDAGDTQPISVQGLDINGDLVEQIVTLNGTTRVALDTPLWRVFRMENEADEGGDINGTVRVYVGTGGYPSDADTRAQITNGFNQSLMSLYTIPKGKVGFLFRGEAGCSRSNTSGTAQASYYSRRLGKVFKVKKRFALVNQGTSTYIDNRSFPDIVPALTDIKLRVEDVSANNIGVYGAFDILLVDEELLDQGLVNAIQPY